jgi:phage protein D
MTAPGSAAVRPERAGDGYAPDFAVLVEGRQVNEAARNDIRHIQVTLNIEEMSSVKLTFNNWDEQKLRFKYSESQDGPFAVGHRVEVQLGYGGNLIRAYAGPITSLQASYPESGSPTISVGSTDSMQKLKNRKAGQSDPVVYRNMADWQIAKKVAARHKLAAKVDEEGPVHDLVVQKNQSDAAFLMERAKRIDFECFVRTDPDTGRDTLHFLKPTDGRTAGPGEATRYYQLAYGPGLAGEPQPAGVSTPLIPSLVSFAPSLTLSGQVSSLTVRGWNPRTKSALVYTATRRDLPPGRGLTGPQAAEQALDARTETVIDAPVATQEEARRLATALLRERAYGFVTASGRIAGLPQLQPGDNLDIHGVGNRFSGQYYVLQVVHTLDVSGFFTDFTSRRVYDGTRS